MSLISIHLEQYMITPGYSIHRLGVDHAILLHETHSVSLNGVLYIDTLTAIANMFINQIARYSIADIYYATDYLKTRGYIYEKQTVTPNIIHKCEFSKEELYNTSLSINGTSPFLIESMTKALIGTGFTSVIDTPGSSVNLIVCSDYLESGVSEMLKCAFSCGAVYCFLVKLAGKVLWIGPLFQKGQRPCWNCLLRVLKRNRPVESFLSKLTGSQIVPKNIISPISMQIGLNAAIMHLIKKIQINTHNDSELLTIDTQNLSVERHYIRVLPQCEVCGNSSQFSEQVKSPIEITDVPRLFTQSGGYRSTPPEITWENYRHLISPVTGIVSYIAPCNKKNSIFRSVWKATYFVSPLTDVNIHNEKFVRNSFGKGNNAAQSRTSALCEAIERYANMYTGEEPKIRGSYNKLKPSAINPETLQFYTMKQYALRESLNALSSPQKIPLPFDPDKVINWTPVWSFTRKKWCYLPLEYCYSMTPTVREENVTSFSSNGSAAGNCIEEAILQGFLELVERDATAIWWYNRIKRPQIDLESFNDNYFNEVKKHYKALGWDLWVLDITHDLQIPSVIALSKNKENGHFAIGLGTHLSMYLAIQRAITEMHQTFDPEGNHDPIWTEEQIEQKSFLYPAENQSTGINTWILPPERSLKDDILDCVKRVEAAGMEFLVLNYTRPDIGVPTVKVIVPGLRHFWKQLGPGRLYSVPVKMGWIDQELEEDSMNPIELAV